MDILLVIIAQDLEIIRAVRRFCGQQKLETVVFQPGTPLPDDIMTRPAVILLDENYRETVPSFAQLNLPSGPPLLIIGNTTVPPTHVQQLLNSADVDQFFDYLGGEEWLSLLPAKLGLFAKITRVLAEREDYIHHHGQIYELFATRDSLTGLYNREKFGQLLAEALYESRVHHTELTLIYLNIDFLTEINKQSGYHFGDHVLIETARRISTTLQESETCFRLWGGDFAIILPGTGEEEAEKIASRLHQSCSESPYVLEEIQRNISLSLGIAAAASLKPNSPEELAEMGQLALDKAKASGRGRTHLLKFAEDEEQTPVGYDFETVKFSLQRILERTRTATISSLELLARDIAGPYYRKHLELATSYTEIFCNHLGLTPAISATLKNSLILYSSIRYFLHSDLLSKHEPFDSHDSELMRDYPYKLGEIIDIFDYFSQERSLLSARSEKYDGSGYPEGLMGSEIPLGARILNIIDSFAAMQSNRPHRQPLSGQQIVLELKEQAGKQFDPFLVLQLLDTIRQNNLLELDHDYLDTIRDELFKNHFEQTP